MLPSTKVDIGETGRHDARGGVVVAGPSALAPRGANLPLFRPEALAERQAQWVGTVLLTPRASHRLFTLTAMLACAAVLGLLFFGSYTRTAHVNGWLVPQQGVIRIFAPRPGVVSSLQVAEGAQVRKGDRLLTLSDELQSSALGATQAQIMRRLDERRDSLLNERDKHKRLLAQQQGALADRVAALDAEHAQIGSEIDLLKARVAIAARSEDLHRTQFEMGFISEQRLQLVQAEKLEQRARIAALERTRLALGRERMAAQAELKDLPLKFQKDFASVERSIAQLDQERAEAEARREIVVSAPMDGTATSIQAVSGAGADTTVPLLSIVPSDARLEAHLYSPSRAVGFVRPGQRVLLRHQAYPYQKFGHQEGVVVSVSRSAASPAELPRQLAGMTSLTGLAAGGGAEPVYRITVSLASQTIGADGRQVALQPGMLLEADVALEQRRLYEWVLDPLYTVTGRSPG
jgi:membrane fusion protein